MPSASSARDRPARCSPFCSSGAGWPSRSTRAAPIRAATAPKPADPSTWRSPTAACMRSRGRVCSMRSEHARGAHARPVRASSRTAPPACSPMAGGRTRSSTRSRGASSTTCCSMPRSAPGVDVRLRTSSGGCRLRNRNRSRARSAPRSCPSRFPCSPCSARTAQARSCAAGSPRTA